MLVDNNLDPDRKATIDEIKLSYKDENGNAFFMIDKIVTCYHANLDTLKEHLTSYFGSRDWAFRATHDLHGNINSAHNDCKSRFISEMEDILESNRGEYDETSGNEMATLLEKLRNSDKYYV